MDYYTFFIKCKELTTVSKDPTSYWNEEKYGEKSDCISVKWVTGGTSRSWDSNTCERVTEPEPVDFIPLEEILSEFWPSVTFLEYRKVCRELIKYETGVSDSDYYSETKYDVKYILLTDLYKYLKELEHDFDL